ncbi:neuroglobin-like [Glandiceps talaboti]
MGCSVSKAPTAYQDNYTDPYIDKKTQPIDQRLPLTARQKFQITKSWKGIARNMENTGKSMFIRLFQSNVDLKRMFRNLDDFDDLEDLRESQQLENHASLVMYTIDEAIASLEDVDFVIELLRKIGRTHKRTHFNPDLFWKIEQPFLAAVKETLEDRYTKNMEDIYKKVFKFIVHTLQSGVDEAIEQGSDSNDNEDDDEVVKDVNDVQEKQNKHENDVVSTDNNYEDKQVTVVSNGKGR